jgi:hypothetical protein
MKPGLLTDAVVVTFLLVLLLLWASERRIRGWWE